ncbi:hypothetical protein D9V75_02640 [Buchnera aphidicola (Muscaphis stroyani)]|uniref:Pimeloyl-[acyl-carrier protein] methyl ester esterase n=1 Tax=Buchnera aphidicola (Muscaphis stroyani) TaxID=1241869 RepID=A0A4D6Y591_9GAMM|nr:hypothetical protein [Buchnera aphidicola]QCI24577.1 hypothetical protein D9V75_02640 [Buchnera aphidicola (Muscaphis stroyani)]
MFYFKKKWPGIQKKQIKSFYLKLKKNYYQTIDNFLKLQNLYSHNINKELEILKKLLFSQSYPNLKTLKDSLKILFLTDLRNDIISLKIPFLRIYGSLDSLIPCETIKILDQIWPQTCSIILNQAAHTPFISHKKEFCLILSNFIRNIKK